MVCNMDYIHATIGLIFYIAYFCVYYIGNIIYLDVEVDYDIKRMNMFALNFIWFNCLGVFAILNLTDIITTI